jgi:hypothetical protein
MGQEEEGQEGDVEGVDKANAIVGVTTSFGYRPWMRRVRRLRWRGEGG